MLSWRGAQLQRRDSFTFTFILELLQQLNGVNGDGSDLKSYLKAGVILQLPPMTKEKYMDTEI
jgi:hypothetical protein